MRRYLDRVIISDGPLTPYNSFLWSVPTYRCRYGQYRAHVKLWEVIEDNGRPRSTVIVNGTNMRQFSICYGGVLSEI